MGALVHMPPRPHDQMKLGKPRGKKAKKPHETQSKDAVAMRGASAVYIAVIAFLTKERGVAHLRHSPGSYPRPVLSTWPQGGSLAVLKDAQIERRHCLGLRL